MVEQEKAGSDDSSTWPDLQLLEQISAFMQREGIARLDISRSDEHISLERELALGASQGFHLQPQLVSQAAAAQAAAAQGAAVQGAMVQGAPLGAAAQGAPFVAQSAAPTVASPAATSAVTSAAAPTAVATVNQQTSQGIADGSTIVRTPILGIAYRSKDPDSEPFVSVGATVNAGDVLCLVEAMKMFSEITAPVAGTIVSIDFEDGALVEHNAQLFTIG